MRRTSPAISRAALLGAALLLACAACPGEEGPCTANDDCDGDELCVDGVCRSACNSDLDCTGRESCQDGVCLPALPDGDAGATDAGHGDTAPADTAVAPDRAVADTLWRPDAVPDAAAPDDAGSAVDAADAARADAPAPADAVVPPDALGVDAPPPGDAAGDAARADAAPADALEDAATADSALADAPAGDAALPPPVCGTVDVMQDDFADGAADVRWEKYSGTGAQVVEASGELQITLPQGGSSSVFAGYVAGQTSSLLGRALSVELVEGVAPLSDAMAALIFRRDAQNQMVLCQRGSLLVATRTVSGISHEEHTAYSEASHRFLSIREQAGSVFFETSPDGQTWTVLMTEATPFFAGAGYVMLEGGAWQPAVAPGTVRFDNLNAGRPAEDWCPASTLQDDFSRPSLYLHWDPRVEDGCSLEVVDSALWLRAEQPVMCSLSSASVYRLALSSVEVEVARLPVEDADVTTGLFLWSPFDDTYTEVFVDAGDHAGVYVSFTDHYVSISVADPRWLRIRSDEATLHWEVQDADGAWHPLYSTSAPASDGFYFVGLWLDCSGCASPLPVPVSAAFDNLNQREAQ